MAETSKPLKCAVIGIGYLGKFHAQKYADLKGAELVALCDSQDSDLIKELSEKYNTEICKDYHDLIGKVDAVSIVTPTTTHFNIAKFFLDNGVHVLLEKPITSTLQDGKELTAFSEAHPELILQVGHLERLNSAFLALQERVKKPLYIDIKRLTPFQSRATDVSVIIDLMIHDIDLAAKIAKSEVVDIKATGYKLFTDHLDFTNAKLTFQNGVIANLTAGRLFPKQFAERTMQVIEPDSFTHIDFGSKVMTYNSFPKGEELKSVQQDQATESVQLEANDAILDEIKCFIDSIQNNKPPIVNAYDATYALEIADRIETLAEGTHATK